MIRPIVKRVALLLCLAMSAVAEPVRLGIISTVNTRAVADVLTAELSKNDSVHLLERDAIEKLVSEAELTEMLGNKAYAKFRKLIGAEALIILWEDEKSKGATARLVAVEAGAVLCWLPMPSDDPGVAATQLKDTFLPYLDKIRLMNAGGVSPVSLLGLRFELDVPDSLRLERDLNTRLAQALSRSRDVIVLERWDLLKLATEKNIASNTENPFWATSMLIDGRIKRNDDSLDIEVRLRSSQGCQGTGR